MDRTRTAMVSDPKDFFSTELRSVLEKHQVKAHELSVNYVVSLLLKYLDARHFYVLGKDGKPEDNVLATLYGEYLQADQSKQRVILQRIGDICLLVSGFFAESIHSKSIDIGYYFGMGGNAYAQLSRLQETKGSMHVYGELSAKFQPFSNALGELSERSGIQNNRDILRLYERWLSTGSDRLKNILTEQGIAVPVKIDPNTKH